MTDIHGVGYLGKTVAFVKKSDQRKISWLMTSSLQGNSALVIEVNVPEQWNYKIISINGSLIKKGFLQRQTGRNYERVIPEILSRGMYVVQAIDPTGGNYGLMYKKN